MQTQNGFYLSLVQVVNAQVIDLDVVGFERKAGKIAKALIWRAQDRHVFLTSLVGLCANMNSLP
jgi:hypothetical protein